MSASFATDHWPNTDSSVTFIPSDARPDLPVTAVKIYAFEKNMVLMAKVGRGWDLPGGHVDPGETPETAIARELKEETGAIVKDSRLIGYLRITNAKETEQNRKYPKEACILVYVGTEIMFDGAHDMSQFEATDRKLVPIEQAKEYHHSWSELNRQVLAYAHVRLTESDMDKELRCKPTWIIFDVGGVLLDWRSSLQSLAGELGITRDQLLDILFDQSTGNNIGARMNVGELTAQEGWRLVLKKLGRESFDPEYILQRAHAPEFWMQDTLQFVRKLHDAGYKLAIMSNSWLGLTKPEKKDSFPKELQLFDMIFDSSIEGVKKPDRAFYEIVEQQTGCNHEALLLIDDEPRNLAVAKERGWQTILYDPASTESTQALIKLIDKDTYDDLLATIYPEDVDPSVSGFAYNTYKLRTAGRAIIFDGDKVALIRVSTQGYYMLPGGGIEDEAIPTALRREVREETGYDIAIERPIGSIAVYFDRWNQRQIDVCYVAKKIDNVDQARTLTDLEKQSGYETVWASNLDEAIRLVQAASPAERDGKLVRARDLLFLQTLARQRA